MNEIQIWGMCLSAAGKKHEKQEVYKGNGICGTIAATSYKDPPKLLFRQNGEKIICL